MGLVGLLNAFSFEKFDAWAESAPRVPQTAEHSGRGDLAIILSMQAWSFIVFHELGHHAMQHLRAFGAGLAGLAYTEVEELVPECLSLAKSSDRSILPSQADAELPEVILLHHANELEADRYSIAKMLSGFFRAHGAVAINSANYKAMETMSELSRTRLWVFTIGIAFLLVE